MKKVKISDAVRMALICQEISHRKILISANKWQPAVKRSRIPEGTRSRISGGNLADNSVNQWIGGDIPTTDIAE